MWKRILAGAAGSLWLITAAAAEAPSNNTPTGPYNPNAPGDAPDVAPGSPCSGPSLAETNAAQAGGSPGALIPPAASPTATRDMRPLANEQCAGRAAHESVGGGVPKSVAPPH